MSSEIRLHNGKQVLYVDGAPFFAVAGEAHNSDSSSPEYMEKIDLFHDPGRYAAQAGCGEPLKASATLREVLAGR